MNFLKIKWGGVKKRPLEIGQLSIEQALRGFAVKPKLELSAEL